MKRCKNVMDYKQKWALVTPVFIAALFTVAKTRKQSKCLSTDERIKKTCVLYVCIYMEY